MVNSTNIITSYCQHGQIPSLVSLDPFDTSINSFKTNKIKFMIKCKVQKLQISKVSSSKNLFKVSILRISEQIHPSQVFFSRLLISLSLTLFLNPPAIPGRINMFHASFLPDAWGSGFLIEFRSCRSIRGWYSELSRRPV